MILFTSMQAGPAWKGIAESTGMSPVRTRSAAMGMNAMPGEKPGFLGTTHGLPQGAAAILTEFPTKIVTTIPCIYRFYETVGVYGLALKALIHEKSGDRVKAEMSGNNPQHNPW